MVPLGIGRIRRRLLARGPRWSLALLGVCGLMLCFSAVWGRDSLHLQSAAALTDWRMWPIAALSSGKRLTDYVNYSGLYFAGLVAYTGIACSWLVLAVRAANAWFARIDPALRRAVLWREARAGLCGLGVVLATAGVIHANLPRKIWLHVAEPWLKSVLATPCEGLCGPPMLSVASFSSGRAPKAFIAGTLLGEQYAFVTLSEHVGKYPGLSCELEGAFAICAVPTGWYDMPKPLTD